MQMELPSLIGSSKKTALLKVQAKAIDSHGKNSISFTWISRGIYSFFFHTFFLMNEEDWPHGLVFWVVPYGARSWTRRPFGTRNIVCPYEIRQRQAVLRSTVSESGSGQQGAGAGLGSRALRKLGLLSPCEKEGIATKGQSLQLFGWRKFLGCKLSCTADRSEKVLGAGSFLS